MSCNKKKIKKGFLYSLILSAVLSLSGCGSKYEPKTAAALKPVELSAMYDEINGYHIPGLTWDMKKKEVEEEIGAFLGKASEGLEKTYYIENDDVEKIDDCVTSNIDYAFSPKGTLVNVTYNFYIDDYSAEELDALYDRIREAFVGYYGDADGTGESVVEQGRIVFYTETVKWEKKLPDGRISSLQAARANTGGETEVVSVGTTVYAEEEGKKQ